jgi:hypothetical protein
VRENSGEGEIAVREKNGEGIKQEQASKKPEEWLCVY